MWKLKEIHSIRLIKFKLPQPESVKIKMLTEATQIYLLEYKKSLNVLLVGCKPAATFVYPCMLWKQWNFSEGKFIKWFTSNAV